MSLSGFQGDSLGGSLFPLNIDWGMPLLDSGVCIDDLHTQGVSLE